MKTSKSVIFLFTTVLSCALAACGEKKSGTVKDYDGNVYETRIVNTSDCMTEKLRVKHFSNGIAIKEARTNQEWVTAIANGEPAWCYINNDPKTEKSGLLYNIHVVTSSHGIAPKSWHVASLNRDKVFEANTTDVIKNPSGYIRREDGSFYRIKSDETFDVFWLLDDDQGDFGYFGTTISRLEINQQKIKNPNAGYFIVCIRD